MGTAGALDKCKGKTIADWELGTLPPRPIMHGTEQIIHHFTDGGKLTIDIGSNPQNISWDHKGVKPSDFNADFLEKYED